MGWALDIVLGRFRLLVWTFIFATAHVWRRCCARKAPCSKQIPNDLVQNKVQLPPHRQVIRHQESCLSNRRSSSEVQLLGHASQQFYELDLPKFKIDFIGNSCAIFLLEYHWLSLVSWHFVDYRHFAHAIAINGFFLREAELAVRGHEIYGFLHGHVLFSSHFLRWVFIVCENVRVVDFWNVVHVLAE